MRAFHRNDFMIFGHTNIEENVEKKSFFVCLERKEDHFAE